MDASPHIVGIQHMIIAASSMANVTIILDNISHTVCMFAEIQKEKNIKWKQMGEDKRFSKSSCSTTPIVVDVAYINRFIRTKHENGLYNQNVMFFERGITTDSFVHSHRLLIISWPTSLARTVCVWITSRRMP